MPDSPVAVAEPSATGSPIGRAEAAKPSRAERTTSYAVADFPVPSGREEEWRFTPVDRLQALFAETSGTALRREESLPAGRR